MTDKSRACKRNQTQYLSIQFFQLSFISRFVWRQYYWSAFASGTRQRAIQWFQCKINTIPTNRARGFFVRPVCYVINSRRTYRFAVTTKPSLIQWFSRGRPPDRAVGRFYRAGPPIVVGLRKTDTVSFAADNPFPSAGDAYNQKVICTGLGYRRYRRAGHRSRGPPSDRRRRRVWLFVGYSKRTREGRANEPKTKHASPSPRTCPATKG